MGVQRPLRRHRHRIRPLHLRPAVRRREPSQKRMSRPFGRRHRPVGLAHGVRPDHRVRRPVVPPERRRLPVRPVRVQRPLRHLRHRRVRRHARPAFRRVVPPLEHVVRPRHRRQLPVFGSHDVRDHLRRRRPAVSIECRHLLVRPVSVQRPLRCHRHRIRPLHLCPAGRCREPSQKRMSRPFGHRHRPVGLAHGVRLHGRVRRPVVPAERRHLLVRPVRVERPFRGLRHRRIRRHAFPAFRRVEPPLEHVVRPRHRRELPVFACNDVRHHLLGRRPPVPAECRDLLVRPVRIERPLRRRRHVVICCHLLAPFSCREPTKKSMPALCRRRQISVFSRGTIYLRICSTPSPVRVECHGLER